MRAERWAKPGFLRNFSRRRLSSGFTNVELQWCNYSGGSWRGSRSDQIVVVTEVLMALYDETETEEKSWQDFANCLGVDPDLFFPERGASTREAKEVCRGCVVREDCLEYALQNGEKFGIWGGMSERERRRIRRQRALARAAAAQAGNVTA